MFNAVNILFLLYNFFLLYKTIYSFSLGYHLIFYITAVLNIWNSFQMESISKIWIKAPLSRTTAFFVILKSYKTSHAAPSTSFQQKETFKNDLFSLLTFPFHGIPTSQPPRGQSEEKRSEKPWLQIPIFPHRVKCDILLHIIEFSYIEFEMRIGSQIFLTSLVWSRQHIQRLRWYESGRRKTFLFVVGQYEGPV